MPEFTPFIFWLGVVGGAVPDILRFVKGRYRGFPEWFMRPGYWVALVVLMALGGAAAWLGGATDWKSAVAMGFTAPEVLSRMFSTRGQQKRDSVSRNTLGFPVRDLWAS